MKLTQNHIDHLIDQIQRGIITADEANIEKVRIARVQIVTGRMPAQVRKALNGAVKRGYLGHWKRDGKKPEVYFHPTFDYLAREARSKHERKVISALQRNHCKYPPTSAHDSDAGLDLYHNGTEPVRIAGGSQVTLCTGTTEGHQKCLNRYQCWWHIKYRANGDPHALYMNAPQGHEECRHFLQVEEPPC